MITLWADHSLESEAVASALQEEGVDYKIVFAASTVDRPIPEIESLCGSVCGFNNILRYLLPSAQRFLSQEPLIRRNG